MEKITFQGIPKYYQKRRHCVRLQRCKALCIYLFPIIMLVFKLELQMKLLLSGLAFIWLSANHWKRVFEELCSLKMTSSKSLLLKKECYHNYSKRVIIITTFFWCGHTVKKLCIFERLPRNIYAQKQHSYVDHMKK